MRRDELEHLIRASGSILDEDGIIVIGSQSILGEHPENLPRAAIESIEADLLPFDDFDGRKADLIDGTIGEATLFHDTFGVYGHGVGLNTAQLPGGWRERLVPLANKNTNGVVGYCLETHDLLVAKYLAGRPKDLEFCAAVVAAGFVEEKILKARLADTVCTLEQRDLVVARIGRDFGIGAPGAPGRPKPRPRL